MPRDNTKKNYLAIPPKPSVVAVQTPSIGQSVQHGVSVGIGAGIGSSIGNAFGRFISDRYFSRLEEPTVEKCNVERIEFENCIRTSSSCEDKQYSFQQCLQTK